MSPSAPRAADPAAPSRRPAPRRRKRVLAKLALVPAGLLGALLLLELGLRAYHGELLVWENLRRPFAHRPMTGKAAGAFDPELGWVLQPGEYRWQGGGVTGAWQATVDESGLRRNGGPRPPGRPLLAVGDSFTLGNEVDDDETYPACLERLLSRAVLNAGVSSYGLDQAVLRAERLLPVYDPEVVVLAYIEDDIMRCELCYHTTWKPYFDLENDVLVLRNCPVPSGTTENGAWRPTPPPSSGWIGYSHLARLLGQRFAPSWWLFGMGRMHRRGTEVAGRLLVRAARSAREHGAALLVVRLFPDRAAPELAPEIDYARAAGVDVLDLGPEILAAAQAAKPGEVLLGSGHLSPRMNQWAAERIAERLRPLLAGR